MDFFEQKDTQTRLSILGFICVCVVLVIFAMFSTSGQQGNVAAGLETKYILLPESLEVGISQGIRLLLLGLFSGIIGGMMGMGGGVVKASGLVLIFGLEVLLVRSIALITNVFIYGSAAYQYSKKRGVVLKKIAELMIPGALIGVALGFGVGLLLHSGLLQKLLGVFALYSGLDMFRRVYFAIASNVELSKYTDQQFRKENKIKIAGAGFPMGMVMGLFGISGGVIGVPYQRFILKIPMKNAIANTSITSLIASIFALFFTLWYEFAYGQHGIATPLIMALWIIPGNIAGARMGAFLTGILPLKFIKISYIAIMLVIGFKLLF